MASAYFPMLRMAGQTAFSTYASVAGILMVVRTMISELNRHIPPQYRDYIVKIFFHVFKITSFDKLKLIVEEHEGFSTNQLYEAAEIYLRTIKTPTIDRLKVSKTQRQNKFNISFEKREETIVDSYEGVKITWKLTCDKSNKNSMEYIKWYFQVVFHIKFKDMVLGSYLPYVMECAEKTKKEAKVVRLYTRNGLCDEDGQGRNGWGSIKLEHPFPFDKLAMDPGQKKRIIEDLDRFMTRKEFYQRIGKVWKRGYLLYGPPGTGKTSLIAAMANYLKFDIYDFQLSSIFSDSDLRRILMSTTSRSILIFEDIDCCANTFDRGGGVKKSVSKLTLSGLLNMIDGLSSSCDDARIIVFTTNHKEMIDPALLRPGRMDFHIHMSYCTPAGFRILIKTYFGLMDAHPLFEEIDKLLPDAKITPARVAEELLRSEDREDALNDVLSLLKQMIAEPEPQLEDKKSPKGDGTTETESSDDELW